MASLDSAAGNGVVLAAACSSPATAEADALFPCLAMSLDWDGCNELRPALALLAALFGANVGIAEVDSRFAADAGRDALALMLQRSV